MQERDVAHVQGVELSQDNVYACVERGVPVVQADIDEGYVALQIKVLVTLFLKKPYRPCITH